jgi:hypothetical protein
MSKIEVDAIEPQSGTTLTIGASGDTITIPSGATLTNSGTATGFGKVLQVLQNTHTFSFNTTSATYVDTGMATPSITPASTSSKFLVTFNTIVHANNGANANVTANFAIYKSVAGGADTSVQTEMNRFRLENTGGLYDGTQLINLLISPSTTSSIVFKLYMRALSTNPYLNPNGSDIMTSTIMEIE